MARSSRQTLFALVLFLTTCGFLGVLFAQRNPSVAPGSDSDVRDSLKQFTEVYSVVEQNYAEPVNADKAIYNGAIPGMLHVLDPHSNFFDPKAYALLREDQRGKYYGVGMTVGPRNNKVIVIAPFAGTPAYRAGIHPGDIIAAVDGKPTDNMNTSDVADLLKGPKGTTVHITVLREGAEKPLEFAVVRDEIPRYSVDLHFMIKPGIGYMHVSGFQETTEHEVAEALDQMGVLGGSPLRERRVAAEIRGVDDERVALPPAARVARPLRERAVWTTVSRDDARVVNHLVQQHDVIRMLNDLDVLVVPARKHLRARIEPHDAAVAHAPILGVIRQGMSTLLLLPNLPLGIGFLLRRGGERRKPAIGRVDSGQRNDSMVSIPSPANTVPLKDTGASPFSGEPSERGTAELGSTSTITLPFFDPYTFLGSSASPS